MIDIEKINTISYWKQKLTEAEKTLEEVSHPFNGSPGVLLKCYKEMFGDDWHNVENTRIFLFVYYYNFSPTALLGATLKKNSRRVIAEMLGIRSHNAVSIRAKNLLFYYRTFPSFRKKADALQRRFMERSCAENADNCNSASGENAEAGRENA